MAFYVTVWVLVGAEGCVEGMRYIIAYMSASDAVRIRYPDVVHVIVLRVAHTLN